jgi:hypothetical protein
MVDHAEGQVDDVLVHSARCLAPAQHPTTGDGIGGTQGGRVRGPPALRREEVVTHVKRLMIAGERRGQRRRRQAAAARQLLERDLRPAMAVVCSGEVRSMRRKQRERVGDVAAVDGEMVARLVIGRRGTRVEVKAGEVEDIVRGEELDQVAEGVAGECRVLDLERRASGEGDGRRRR